MLSDSCNWKKRGLEGEGLNLGTTEHVVSAGDVNENIDGSGMAEAGDQPRQPQ